MNIFQNLLYFRLYLQIKLTDESTDEEETTKTGFDNKTAVTSRKSPAINEDQDGEFIPDYEEL